MRRQKIKIYKGQPKGCPYMVVEIKDNQYITIALILEKRFKNITFRLFAVLSFNESKIFATRGAVLINFPVQLEQENLISFCLIYKCFGRDWFVL